MTDADSFAFPVSRLETRHGLLTTPAHDRIVGRSLEVYGEWTWPEIDLLTSLLRPGDVVADVGAYIGTHAIPIARAVGPSGAVVAFEPQPGARMLLEANLAANDISQVRVMEAACGARGGRLDLPPSDYARPGNFGALSLGSESDRGQGEVVEVVALDDVFAGDALRLIKADVEGMEAEVVGGARSLIERHQPVLYLESEFPEASAELLSTLAALSYRGFWHVVPLFNPSNLRGVRESIFGAAVCVNLLALPAEAPDPAPSLGLTLAIGSADHPRHVLARKAERMTDAIVAALCRQAASHLAAGRYGDAIAAAQKALAACPDSELALVQMATAEAALAGPR